MDEEIRCYKGPPSLAITEHWNYADEGKDFFGGYAYMSQGPLPVRLGRHAVDASAASGAQRAARRDGALQSSGRAEDRRRDACRRSATASRSPTRRINTACRSPRVTYSYCDNDKQLIRHALGFMRQALEAVGATRDLGRDRRHLPPQRHRPHGRRSARPASSTPTAAAGTSPICGSATARCFRPSAASIRR